MYKNATMHGRAMCLLLLFGAFQVTVSAQTEGPCDERATYYYWVGGASNDFFDEMNWREANRKIEPPPPGTDGGPGCRPGILPKFVMCRRNFDPEKDKIPKAGTLEPGIAIPFNLLVEGASLTINSPLIFSCIDKGLTLDAAQLVVNAKVQGTINLENNSTLRMAGTSVPNGLRISLLDHNSWAYFEKVKPLVLANLPLATWMVDLQVPVSLSALLINQYYKNGSLVRIDPMPFQPLTVFNSQTFGGNVAKVSVDTIFAGGAIPGGMNNNIRSFKLKRGFMATLASNTNGTGKSQVFIASEKDLEVPILPAALNGNVSFIRVMPWNWVTKKGTGGFFENNPLDAGWFYIWSAGQTSKLEYENVPMAWGAGATNPAGMQTIINKKRTGHVLGFNESDNCNGESGQFNNLCQPDVAVAYYERLMGSGLRLGTPAPRENGPTTWLRQFAAIAKQRDVRFDFVAVHWYDWGSNPANTPNANPQDVFNRFKAYLTQVYNEYQLPIWITEFNANPNRQNSVHAAFLELALPYLESLPYIERYAYFQPMAAFSQNGDPNANYFDEGGNFTNIGTIYRDHSSTPSMPDDTYICPNNLDGLNQPQPVKQVQQFVFEVECGEYPGSKWTVGENEAASNGKFLQGNSSLAGETPLAKQIHFDFDVTEENNFRLWIRSKATNGNMSIQVDHGKIDTILGVNSTDFAWQSIAKLYSFTPGKHRVSLAFVNTTTQFDQFAIVAGSDDPVGPMQPADYCAPEPAVWGLTAGVPIFIEAENTGKGASWSIGNDADAIGGLFVQSGAATSPDAAPAESGWLTFSMDVATAGAYQFWAKMQSLETTSNKLWVKVNDGDFSPWNDLQQTGYLWKWKRYDPARNGGTRQDYLFLEPGTQTITIAYASGGVKIDRVALMPAGNSPVAIDPDVIMEIGPQSFEAEEAEFIGSPTIAAACATASNGLIVNMGTAGSNGLKFNNILVSGAGTYQLAIGYFVNGANRSMRVFVNGTLQPIQSVSQSGAWCFNGGSPGTWLMSVNLNAGSNTIELRPVVSQNAPLIDKIEIRPVLQSFEAELAQLTGSVTTPNCGNASNGMLANMGNTLSNAIQFNNISVSEAGTYQLNIAHFSKVVRTMRMFVNGGTATVISFGPTGNWCFESPAGVAVVKGVPVTLNAGTNTIRFQPHSGDAPILDKIDLVDPSNPEREMLTAREPEPLAAVRQPVAVASGLVYPNPARAGSTIYLPTDNNRRTLPVSITLIDVRGSVIKSNVQSTPAGFLLPQVAPGLYLLRVNESGSVKTYRILVQ